MLKVILDTNVLVAAARSRSGASARILSMVGTGKYDLCMSAALALEYEEVLKREQQDLLIEPREIDELINFLCSNSIRCETGFSRWPLTSDPDDEFIARLAAASACDHLITHNLGHLRSLQDSGISVVTPGNFLGIMEKS